MQTDILSALDKQAGVFLSLTDLSAAFDTVDHNILLDLLKDTISINGTAWRCCKSSYLSGRTEHVSVAHVMSEVAELLFRVPHCSVLGSIR